MAAELERSASRAQARKGLAAAAAFLEHAAALTPDPTQRAERALAAVQAKIQAGAFDAAEKLLGMAEAAPLGEFQRARADLLRAQLAFAASQGSDAPPLLLRAAKRLESIDADLARATYLDAMMAALFAAAWPVPMAIWCRWHARPVRHRRRRTRPARPISSSTAWPRTSARGFQPELPSCGVR